MWSEMFDMFVQSFWETLIMVGISGLVGAAIGLPLGVLLYLTDRDGVLQNIAANRAMGVVVNAVRSTPFIILLVAVIPFTRLVVGSSIGTAAAVPIDEPTTSRVNGITATSRMMNGVERTAFTTPPSPRFTPRFCSTPSRSVR